MFYLLATSFLTHFSTKSLLGLVFSFPIYIYIYFFFFWYIGNGLGPKLLNIDGINGFIFFKPYYCLIIMYILN